MRKSLLILLSAALVVAFALPASAVILGSRHDMTTLSGTTWGSLQGGAGACSFCHIPHKATGAKAWSGVAGGVQSQIGTVGQLCYNCHGSTGIMTGRATVVDVQVELTSLFHGLRLTPLPPNTAFPATGLPYVNGDNITNGLMECSSCHDPHNTTANTDPFLQGSFTVNNLCEQCHQSRGTVTAATAQGFGGSGNIGTHPIGLALPGPNANGNKPTTYPSWAQATRGSVASVTGSGNAWVVGAHTSTGVTGGNLVCVTCHSIHGRQPLAGGASIAYLDNTDGSGTAIRRGLLSLSNTNAASQFCQDCHWQTNPGNQTRFSHPINVNVTNPSASGIYAAAAAPYTYGLDGQTGSRKALCRSCHAVHPGTTGRAAIPATPLLYASVGDGAAYCSNCHPSTATFIATHHPANVPWTSSGGTAGIAANATAINLNNALWLTANNIQCYNCHAGHNNLDGSASRLRLAKTAGVKGVNGGNLNTSLVVDDNTSWTAQCVGCHSYAPANYTQNMDLLKTQGSHFIGTVQTTPNKLPYVYGGAWPAGTTVVSYYEGTAAAPVMICQSCHNLSYNIGTGMGGHLLVATYGDNMVASATNVGLCRKCHIPVQDLTGSATPPAGTWNVGYQLNDTRGTIIQRTHPLEYIQSGNAVRVPTFYPITPSSSYVTYQIGTTPNVVNCESCHSAHGTFIGMGGMILKAASGGAGISGTFEGNYTVPGSPLSWTSILALTNASWFPTVKNEVGYCRQCHGQSSDTTKAK